MSTKKRVLDVGNCDPDHGTIRDMLTRHFDVEVDRVMFVRDAMNRMRETAYNLVLFNRLIFADGSEGLDLVRRAKAEPVLAETPIMMISNYEEAQAACVAAGGEEGFGKMAIHSPETTQILSKFLPCLDQKN